MIILSKSPYDIAAMSVYADYAKNEWGSCLQPDGINSFYLPNEVGYGVFVAFGVNSKDPQKKLARISIKPYLNQSGDVYYGSGFMYGEMMPGVQAQLDAFLKTYQPKEEGIFALHPKVYKDAVGDSYYFNVSALDIVKHQEFKQIEEQDGYINVGNRVFLKKEERVLDELSLFLENNCEPNKLSVSMNTLPCTADFGKMNVYAEFCAYYLSKEKAKFLPHYANELTLISSNIKNLNSISTSYIGLDINLTNALMSLDGISPVCKHLNLSRVDIKTPYFKVPKSLESFTSSLTNWNIQTLDLSEFEGVISFSETDTFYGLKEIKYPKKAKGFNAMLTNFNTPIDFDASVFEHVDFWTGVIFKSFKTGPRLKKLLIMRSVMPEGRLDLSACNKISCFDTSFEHVTELVLPQTGEVVLKNCTFPNGVLVEDVLKNHGFSNSKNIKINTQKPVFKLTQKEREKTV